MWISQAGAGLCKIHEGALIAKVQTKLWQECHFGGRVQHDHSMNEFTQTHWSR